METHMFKALEPTANTEASRRRGVEKCMFGGCLFRIEILWDN